MAKSDVLTPRALGYFSIGLGLTQIAAPKILAQLIGIRPGGTSPLVMRLLGLREIGAGVGILAQPQAAGWLWARVGGDVMDLALLGSSLFSGQNQRGRLSAAIAACGAVMAADVQSAQQLGQGDGTIQFTKAISINRQPEDVYRFWRDFRNFPEFMSHLEAVTVSSDKHSHWRATAPAGRTVEWDAEITADRPNELIVWRSMAGADIDNTGSVRFGPAPGGGTEVRLEMQYTPPAGVLGATVARLFGQEPRQQVQADLRKLKQVLETGDVVRSDASLEGTQLLQRAAQPSSDPPSGGVNGSAGAQWASAGGKAS